MKDSRVAILYIFEDVCNRLISRKNFGHYISYIFLRTIFIENKVPNKFLFEYGNEILKWISVIIKNTTNSNDKYILKIVKYIFLTNFSDLEVGNPMCKLKTDSFWINLVEEEEKTHIKNYRLSTIDFLDDMFLNSPVLNNKKADYYYYQRDYRKALKYLLNTYNIKYYLDKPTQLFRIAYCFHREKDYKNSIHYYSKYLKIKESALAYSNRALAYQSLKMYDSALLDFSKSISIKTSVEFLRLRAVCYMALGQFGKALIDLNSAVDVAPSDSDQSLKIVYRKRAKVKKELGDIQGATADIELYSKLYWKSNTLITGYLIDEVFNNKCWGGS